MSRMRSPGEAPLGRKTFVALDLILAILVIGVMTHLVSNAGNLRRASSVDVPAEELWPIEVLYEVATHGVAASGSPLRATHLFRARSWSQWDDIGTLLDEGDITSPEHARVAEMARYRPDGTITVGSYDSRSGDFLEVYNSRSAGAGGIHSPGPLFNTGYARPEDQAGAVEHNSPAGLKLLAEVLSAGLGVAVEDMQVYSVREDAVCSMDEVYCGPDNTYVETRHVVAYRPLKLPLAVDLLYGVIPAGTMRVTGLVLQAGSGA